MNTPTPDKYSFIHNNVSHSLPNQAIRRIEDKLLTGTAFSESELISNECAILECHLDRHLNEKKESLKKELSDNLSNLHQQTLAILKNIQVYNGLSLCEQCKGAAYIESTEECSYHEMDGYNDGEFWQVTSYECSECNGLGFTNTSSN